MKKLSFVLAAAGLMTLAACGETTPAVNVADNAEAMMENTEEVMDNITENTMDAMENVADNATEAAENAM